MSKQTKPHSALLSCVTGNVSNAAYVFMEEKRWMSLGTHIQT